MQTVYQVLNWIPQRPRYKKALIRFSPINEAYQPPNLSKFACNSGLYDSGVKWLGIYFNAVMDWTRKNAPRTTVVLQDCFMSGEFWIPYLTKYHEHEIVIDSHAYFFTQNVTAYDAAQGICSQRKDVANKKFKTLMGEFSIQSNAYNLFTNRRLLADSQRDAWSPAKTPGMLGSIFWSIESLNDQLKMNGQGTKKHYLSYEALIHVGVLTKGEKQWLTQSSCQ